jgi:hypothetical protein
MIIKGKSRAGPRGLAAHLGNAEKNERVSLLEARGTVSQDLRGALIEMDAYALGTRCERSLYHAAISSAPPHRLSPKQRIEAIDALEAKLGLAGHSSVVVMHEKLGREHIHVVWSRIDLDRMKSVSDSHNYRKHEEVARELERRFGHERVQGAHHERDGVDRPARTPSRAELRQEERTGIKGRDVRAEVTAAFRASDNAEAFRQALENNGYLLAKGDRRDFVIVDRKGGIHSLARRIEDMKAAKLREFMSPIDDEKLPTANKARELQAERERKRKEALTEKSYSGGMGYVTQTQAAMKDHQRRQRAIDKLADHDSLWDRIERGQKKREGDDRRIEEHRHVMQDSQPQAAKDETGGKTDAAEMTDAKRERVEKSRNEEQTEKRRGELDYDDHEPDRQREVPGGGRTRNR